MTQEDIAKARPRQSMRCPVYRCLRRAGVKQPFVRASSLRWTGKDGRWYTETLPLDVQDFIQAYDHTSTREGVRPIGFDLPLAEIESNLQHMGMFGEKA